MSSLFKGESKIGSWEFVIKNRKSKSGGFLVDFPQKSIGKKLSISWNNSKTTKLGFRAKRITIAYL